MKLKKYILFMFNNIDGLLRVIGTYENKIELKSAILEWMRDVDLGDDELSYKHFNCNAMKISGNTIYNAKNYNFGFSDDYLFLFIESKKLFS